MIIIMIIIIIIIIIRLTNLRVRSVNIYLGMYSC